MTGTKYYTHLKDVWSGCIAHLNSLSPGDTMSINLPKHIYRQWLFLERTKSITSPLLNCCKYIYVVMIIQICLQYQYKAFTNGNVAFILKLCGHWLRHSRQRQIAALIQTPGIFQMSIGSLEYHGISCWWNQLGLSNSVALNNWPEACISGEFQKLLSISSRKALSICSCSHQYSLYWYRSVNIWELLSFVIIKKCSLRRWLQRWIV